MTGITRMTRPSSVRKAASAAALALALGAPVREASALVGQWTSYTKLSEVRDVQATREAVFAATGGGIRRFDLKSGSETVFRNTEGLVDASIQGLAATPEGDVWATSELGMLYRLKPGRDRWEPFGGSYKSSDWRMSRRAVLYRAPYLIVGASKGLSFFNTRTGMADANVTKLGQEKAIQVNSLLMVGDTLFVGADVGIYRATLRLDRLLTDQDVNIYNPAIWTLVPGSNNNLFHRPAGFDPAAAFLDTVPGDTVPVDTVVSDSSRIPSTANKSSAHGHLFHTSLGVASEFEGGGGDAGTRASKYGILKIAGQAVANPFAVEDVDVAGGRYFMAQRTGLLEYFPDQGTYKVHTNAEDLPSENITMIAQGEDGVYAYGSPSLFSLQGRIWKRDSGFTVISNHVDANRKGTHPFNPIDSRKAYVGTWGLGFQVYRNGTAKAFMTSNSCLKTADHSNPDFPVVFSQVLDGDQGVWMATLRNAQPYGLAYYDAAADSISCFEVGNRDREPTGIELHGDLLAVITEGGVETFRIRRNDGRLSLDEPNQTPTLRSSEPAQTGKLDDLGNLWVTSRSGKMFYVPSFGVGENAGKELKTLEGFPGRECRSIDRDARGHIWVGCFTGGVIEITPSRDSLGNSFRRYGLNDGLISENVYHLSADSASGKIWVVTDRGISSFESASRPTLRSLSAAKVFPNPFLARHSQVIFDNLAQGSRVKVMTQGGSVVWSRALAAADGGQLRWDGRNLSGNRVREGVYFYSVESSKDSKRGKIIVAR